MKIKPLNDRLLVEQFKSEHKTSGGIIIPEVAKKKPQEGKVIAAGDGYRGMDGTYVKMEVKKGDCILFNAYAGCPIEVDGASYLIMNESEVLAVME